MKFNDSQLKAFELAETRSKQLDRIMLDNYNVAYKNIVSDMEKLYARVLAGIKPEDYYVTVIRYNRLAQLLDGVAKKFDTYSNRAGFQIKDMSTFVMNDMFYRRQFLLASVGAGEVPYKFAPLDPRLVELTVTGTAEAWNKIPKAIQEKYGNVLNYQPQAGSITGIIFENRKQDLVKIQQVITQGFIQGKTIAQMTSSIQDAVNVAKYKAERIARTEFTRTANAGAYAATKDAEAMGIEIKRKWVATLDASTRPVHAALDGQIVGVDEPFKSSAGEVMRPGEFSDAGQNINCRCTVVDIVDGVEPGLRRARKIKINENGTISNVPGQSEVISYKNYNEWLELNGIDPATMRAK